jgi:DNA-binding MarR family transcriptional regulator
MSVRPLRVGEELPPLGDGPERPRRQAPRCSAKEQSSGRFQMLNAFVDGTMADLTRAELAVWLVLFRDTRNGVAAISQENIARRSGCNRRTVNRALRRLEQLGLVKLVYRGGLNGTVSRYRVRPTPT